MNDARKILDVMYSFLEKGDPVYRICKFLYKNKFTVKKFDNFIQYYNPKINDMIINRIREGLRKLTGGNSEPLIKEAGQYAEMKAVAIAIWFGDKVMISKRINTFNYPEYYQFVGGKVDDGEEIVTAALRELKEETGLSLVSFDLVIKDCILTDKGCTKCFLFETHMSKHDFHLVQNPEDGNTPWMLLKPEDLLSDGIRPKLLPGIETYIRNYLEKQP